MDAPPGLSQQDIETYNGAYERATALLQGAVQLDDAPAPQAGQEKRLREAVAALDTCLEIVPGSFACEFLAGKCLQALGEHEAALRRFARSALLDGVNADTVREATIEALRLGLPADAKRYALDACKRAPDDAGLASNLALACLIGGELDKALEAARRAVSMDDGDRVNHAVLELVEAVRSGAKPRPTRIG